MTTALETIPPDEEGATLLPKPKTTGIRRVVVAAAVASFAFGLLAATAVQTSPGRHASNLHSKHEHETIEGDHDSEQRGALRDCVRSQERREDSRQEVQGWVEHAAVADRSDVRP